VAETVAASGEVRGRTETAVGAQTGGRVAALLVREGDVVRAGQVIARLDDRVLRSESAQSAESVRTAQVQLAQAADAIRTAQANLAVASRPPLASDIAKARADARQAVAVAEATLLGKRQRLAELRAGATSEQRSQIAAQVAQARVNLKQAERDYGRQKSLAGQGAVAQSVADAAETARDSARETLENLSAREAELGKAARSEQLAQAQAEIRAAEATVAGAKASGDAAVASLLALPRAEDVAVARARVVEAERAADSARNRLAEARLALEVTQNRLSDTVVTAPFGGTITGIVTEVGGVTGPSQALVKLVRTARPEIRVALDEDNLGRVRVGQKSVISATAFPGETVQAVVREIGAEVNAEKGQVTVKLDPLTVPVWLRPGQTLSVNIVTAKAAPRLVVPLQSVTTAGGFSTVLLVEKGKVVKKTITADSAGPEGVPVSAGLTKSDSVVADPGTASPGQTVTPVSPLSLRPSSE
ncbi:MAG: efflux RND transporter periplasmic adaptor subunit, partial [Fibrella sp.]|nr:efflux RND transporter periplasmic adaptor subunit [Armatimonadota bacterium]